MGNVGRMGQANNTEKYRLITVIWTHFLLHLSESRSGERASSEGGVGERLSFFNRATGIADYRGRG